MTERERRHDRILKRWKVAHTAPPSYWTTDLDGDRVIVDLLAPLICGKWEAIDEDCTPVVVAEEHLGNPA